jgi:hypothetical protein
MGMGENHKGLAKIEGVLKMPPSVRLQNKGTTGMRFPAMKSHSPEIVMQFIEDKARTYGKYQDKIWDCEDYSFLAASDIRCRFLGQPVAIALGIGKEGGPNIIGLPHAINVLWFESDVGGGQKKWIHRYYDATIHKEVKNFETHVIIPLPVSGLTDHKELPPFENFRFLDSAAFVLDGKAYNFDLINSVIDTLEKKGINDCPRPGDIEGGALFDNPLYYSYNDRVFWWFSHIRQMHKGAPVGVAFGKATNPNVPQSFDYASLVLWRSPSDFVYWDIIGAKDATQMDIKFIPRIVIV